MPRCSLALVKSVPGALQTQVSVFPPEGVRVRADPGAGLAPGNPIDKAIFIHPTDGSGAADKHTCSWLLRGTRARGEKKGKEKPGSYIKMSPARIVQGGPWDHGSPIRSRPETHLKSHFPCSVGPKPNTLLIKQTPSVYDSRDLW